MLCTSGPRRAIRFVRKGDAGSGKTTFFSSRMFRCFVCIGSFVRRGAPFCCPFSTVGGSFVREGLGARLVRRGGRYFVRRGAR